MFYEIVTTLRDGSIGGHASETVRAGFCSRSNETGRFRVGIGVLVLEVL